MLMLMPQSPLFRSRCLSARWRVASSCVVALWLCGARLTHAQSPALSPPTAAPPNAAPAPSYAPVTQLMSGAPLRGQWELRLSMGADSALSGNTTPSTTQLYLGLDAAYNLGDGWALGGGFYGAPDDGFFALGGHFDVRYRFWSLVPFVKPTLFGGAGVRLGSPRTGPEQNTSLSINLRVGAGLDFAVSKRVLPGFAILMNVGPRVLPSIGAYVSAQALFTLSFLL